MANNQLPTCPECGVKLIKPFDGENEEEDYIYALYVCPQCNREFEIEETRHSLRIQDGLYEPGANIDKVNKDASGKPLTVSAKNTIERLRKWNNQSYTGTKSEERRINKHKTEINNLLRYDFSSFSQLTPVIQSEIMNLAVKIIKNSTSIKSNILCGACIFEILRDKKHPIPLPIISETIAKKHGKSTIQIRKNIWSLYSSSEFREIANEASKKEKIGSDPMRHINGKKFQVLKISDMSQGRIVKRCLDILNEIRSNSEVIPLDGKNPIGIGASLVFKSMKDLHLNPIQAKIARSFGVSDLVVRTNSKIIDKILERNTA